jgi:hypothetical protein
MKHQNVKAILTFLLWLCFWPLILPAWILLKAPQWKRNSIGASGEAFVSRKLHELDPEHYNVLDNIILPSDGNTTSTQIDHIVVSTYGIFCIETKNHKGSIYGSSKSKYWKQYIYSHQYSLYNPLWQNYGHIKALEKILTLRLHAPIESLIAFPSADKLRVHGTTRVGRTYQIIDRPPAALL